MDEAGPGGDGIAITAGEGSALAREAAVVLCLPKATEACPHGLAPTTSTLLQMAIGDALAVALLEARGFTADHFRTKMKRFFDANVDGWPCWSFSNHDVDRHVSRWAKYAIDQKALARQAVAMLIAVKGSICVYQGEELGLPQADILFEELTDPVLARSFERGCR